MQPGTPRPAPPPHAPARATGGSAVPAAGSTAGPAPVPAAGAGGDRAPGSGHPAVDAALRGIANTASLPPADQIAQYEAAHRTLRETLATIDQA